MAKFQHHILICTNERAPDNPKGCCSAKGSLAVVKAFKIGLVKRGLRRIVRANSSGCLDQCARGTTVVVYPEGTWYGGVTEGDVDEILDAHILGGNPVERLVLRPEDLTGIEPGAVSNPGSSKSGPSTTGPKETDA